MASKHPSPPVAYALLSFASLAWAGNIVVGRAVHAAIPPVSLGFWRWASAFLILLPIFLPRLRRNRAALLREWKLVLLLGLIGVAGFSALQYTALNTASAVNVALINAVSPVVIPVLARLVWRESLSLRQALGIGLSLFGVGFVVLRGDPVLILAQGLTEGDLIMLVAMLCWSVYVTCLGRRPDDLDSGTLLVASIMPALIVLFPIWLWEIAWVRPMAVDVTTILVIAYIGPVATALAYLGYTAAVPAVGPTRAGLFIHLMPPFAAVLGMIFLDERLQAFHYLGAGAIFAGLYLTTAGARPMPPRGV
ncbi:MAG: DMT family transporter [Alphaproteobacteria bacterium]|nr:DMT family transporter [Alphaproteobacteria bacterium]